MDHVLVLTAADDAVDDALLVALRAALGEAGAHPGPAAWLQPGSAAEIPFAGPEAAALARVARAVVAGRPVDANVVARRHRRKALLVADMDATTIQDETLDELAIRAGIADRILPITERAMRGEINFREATIQRVAMLAGQPESLIADVLEAVRPTPGGATLVATMRAHGGFCALVSGGFDAFTGPVARRLGFDRSRGNHLEIADGRLAGTITEPVQGKDAKRAALLAFAAERGVTAEQAVAVGDGANDIPMLETAGLGVAFRAKPKVREAIPVAIDHADLTALLYLQGYRADEILFRG
jgi:phosphoserine phosphatase